MLLCGQRWLGGPARGASVDGMRPAVRADEQLTLSVQHLGDVQVLLRHLEGVVQVGDGVVLHRGGGAGGSPGSGAAERGAPHTSGSRLSIGREKSGGRLALPAVPPTFLSLSYSISSGLCLWIKALKASPSFQLRDRRRR